MSYENPKNQPIFAKIAFLKASDCPNKTSQLEVGLAEMRKRERERERERGREREKEREREREREKERRKGEGKNETHKGLYSHLINYSLSKKKFA